MKCGTSSNQNSIDVTAKTVCTTTSSKSDPQKVSNDQPNGLKWSTKKCSPVVCDLSWSFAVFLAENLVRRGQPKENETGTSFRNVL